MGREIRTPAEAIEVVTGKSFIEPILLRAGDRSVLVNGRPFRADFRVVAEEGYQQLLTTIRALAKDIAPPIGVEASKGAAVYALQVSLGEVCAAAREARDQFFFYAREHTAAGKHEKAATNQRFADMLTDALNSKAMKPTLAARPAEKLAGEMAEATPAIWRRGVGETVAAFDLLKNEWIKSPRKDVRACGELLDAVAQAVFDARQSSKPTTYHEAAEAGDRLTDTARAARDRFLARRADGGEG